MISMNDEEKLELMKDRIVKTYVIQKDIINPLSKDFDCTPEELEHVFFDLLDMSGVLSLHATFETAEYECLVMKFHADLRLCLFVNTLELISKEDANELKEKLANQVMDGKDYSDVLKEGQKELFQLLKNAR